MPKRMRERLRLLDGGPVEIIERGGVIELTPVAAEVEVRNTPEGPVVVAVQPLPALTDAEVRATIDDVRR